MGWDEKELICCRSAGQHVPPNPAGLRSRSIKAEFKLWLHRTSTIRAHVIQKREVGNDVRSSRECLRTAGRLSAETWPLVRTQSRARYGLRTQRIGTL